MYNFDLDLMEEMKQTINAFKGNHYELPFLN